MSQVRLRRLQADYDNLRAYVGRQPRVQLVQAEGDPPERYQLAYRIRGLRRVDDDFQTVQKHLVEILLPASYPRLPPQCRMLTPIFHPNIAPHAICIGDHWSAGEPLVSIVARIGEMIAYQSYNTKSPLNGEAARWVTDNLDQLPLDPVSFLVGGDGDPPGLPGSIGRAAAPPPVRETGPATPTPPPLPPRETGPAAAVEDTLRFLCPGCRQPLRVPAQAAGKRVRCPGCQTLLRVPGGT